MNPSNTIRDDVAAVRSTQPKTPRCGGGTGLLASIALGAALLVSAVGGGGCSTNESKTGSLASITIEGRSLNEIRSAATNVFMGESFRVSFAGGRQLSFDKKAGKMSNWVYGDWANNGEGVWERIRLTFTTSGPTAWRVDADAFRVTNHGQDFFEDETQVSSGHRAECRKLLQLMKDRLATGGTSK